MKTTIAMSLAILAVGCATKPPAKAVFRPERQTAHPQCPKPAATPQRAPEPTTSEYIAFGKIVLTAEFRDIGRNGKVTWEDIIDLTRFYGRLYGIKAEVILAVIKAESNFNPKAVSKSGAQGLMQLMPETARTLGVTDAFHPAQNIAGGTLYLAMLAREFGDNASLVLAAYHAGPGNVKKHGGVPPFKATREYIERVQQYRKLYTNAG